MAEPVNGIDIVLRLPSGDLLARLHRNGTLVVLCNPRVSMEAEIPERGPVVERFTLMVEYRRAPTYGEIEMLELVEQALEHAGT